MSSNPTSFLHRTQTGRVVYERKRHLFRQADVNRILGSLAAQNPTLPFLLKLLIAVEDYMLGIILAPFGQAQQADVVRQILEAVVGLVVGKLAGVIGIKIVYTLSDGTDYTMEVV